MLERDGILNLGGDASQRVQRVERFLEYQADQAPTEVAKLLCWGSEQIYAGDGEFACRAAERGWREAEQGGGEQRFARAGRTAENCCAAAFDGEVRYIEQGFGAIMQCQGTD